MMLDASKGEIQKRLLEKELEAVGIRMNKKPPNIYFKVNWYTTLEETKTTHNHQLIHYTLI